MLKSTTLFCGSFTVGWSVSGGHWPMAVLGVITTFALLACIDQAARGK